MENENKYLNFDNNFKSIYIKNNKLIKSNENILEEIYYNTIIDVDIILSLLKIPANKKGFKYWQDAVFISIIANNNEISICNQIYPIIAKKYNKTERSVERAMRLCFENTLYNVTKFGKNPISNLMHNYLVNPKNSEILFRITKIVVSKEFQMEKGNFKFNTFE